MAEWTVADIPSQSGRLAVVTGANSGIGWHTALELARAGGEVILAARTQQKGQDAVERIHRQIPEAKVRFEILDLASLKSVRAFAAKVNREARLDLLVNNAGVMRLPKRQVTEDGFEVQFGTNFLGPFALTNLLLPAMLRAESARVTTVSSGAANMGSKRINFEDMQGEKGYGPWKAYCQSKLADLMLMTELGRRSVAAGYSLLSNAAHPGFARTNLQTTGPGREMNAAERWMASFMSQDAAHGALPTLRAATDVNAAMGSYYAPNGSFQLKGEPVLVPLPKPARDEAAARKLWEISEELTGVQRPLKDSN
ncbi:oxidoreductase [Granulicella sp. L60]|jgi:NAD(P)-dependent dehydrogenase (short-subunit alcohol dehydrogenase family)|uniref:oxidoreductase n=1 Tax=Granulicella sp. L60 TaxID=1641866 RepID=UPI00131E1FB0|nr:oxidoreductase [Granulicella sp. L60]